MKQYLRIGCIVRAHGVHGAVKIEPATDRLERFRGLSSAFLEQGDSMQPVRIKEVRLLNDAAALRIEGVDSVEAANALRGTFLCVDRAHAVELPKDSYFIADLIGLTASDTEGTVYGKVTDVWEMPANDVYVIEKGKLKVPALKRVLYKVSPEEGKLIFEADALREVGLFED